jgi:hypothetical protein
MPKVVKEGSPPSLNSEVPLEDSNFFIKNKARFTSSLGGLGTKDEAAGKVRVFALVDPFTQ